MGAVQKLLPLRYTNTTTEKIDSPWREWKTAGSSGGGSCCHGAFGWLQLRHR